MRRLRLSLIGLLICVACSCAALVACGEDDYTPRYQTEECSLEVREFNNNPNRVNYNKRFKVDETTLYFDNDFNDNRLLDGWIDRVKKFNEVLKENQFDIPENIYISDKVIANYNTENGVSLSFKPEISEEESLGWILRAVSDNGLPYGIYAGLSAQMLDLTEYSNFVHSSLSTAKYLTELQFPIYEKDNLSEHERKYAWSFSRYLVSGIGKSEKEIATMSMDELESHLQDKYNIVLPEYTFEPYSTKYEYKVEQDCFTYYINREYNDLILPKAYFNTSYGCLSEWLKDNSATTKESNSVFNIGSMYDINVYLDDGLKSNGISGEAGKDYIYLYSVGSFSHEYIHHVLYQRGKSGYLREFFTEYHADKSKFATAMYYYLISGSSDNYPYYEETNEKQSYQEAIKLYNKISAFEASPENFNYWLFCDCFSALYSSPDKKWVSRAQSNSWVYYIFREYGSEWLWALNENNKQPIAGKSTEEVIYEWLDFLKTVKI